MNVPFLLACAAAGTVLPWLGTLALPRCPGWVAVVTDVLIVFVLAYLPPFDTGPPPPGGRGCGSLWSACDPSWPAIGHEYAAVPAAAWLVGTVLLAWPFVVASGCARRRRRSPGVGGG